MINRMLTNQADPIAISTQAFLWAALGISRAVNVSIVRYTMKLIALGMVKVKMRAAVLNERDRMLERQYRRIIDVADWMIFAGCWFGFLSPFLVTFLFWLMGWFA